MHTLHAASYIYKQNIDDKVLFRHKLQVVFRYLRATCASWTWLTSWRARSVDIWWAETSSVCGADSKTITSLINDIYESDMPNNVKYRFILAILSELTPMMTCLLFWVCVCLFWSSSCICVWFSVPCSCCHTARYQCPSSAPPVDWYQSETLQPLVSLPVRFVYALCPSNICSLFLSKKKKKL